MNLFVKIFLWFLAAIALMVGLVFFLNWTVQTEPVVSRWRISVRNQTNIYAGTAAQVYADAGETGLVEFLERIRKSETIDEVQVIGQNGKAWLSPGASVEDFKGVTEKALASGSVEIEFNQPESALSARDFTLQNGERYVLIVRWERPRPTPFFGESPLRYLRFAGLFFAALLLCYAFARYLSSPIGKIRTATQKLADGDLRTRVADQVGRRHDELASLAKDFDVMAERIESLITSQQRLSRDVSHELRSPLARLNVALEIAKQKSNGGDAAPLLARIETESQRLNELISRLLTLASLESGSQDFGQREINLTDLVEQIASDADFEARALGKSVAVSAMEKCRVVGSERLLRSAIENVLRNAVKYTNEGTVVDVSLRADAGKATVKVCDQGGGVPDEELQNLFRPFYRVGEARERKTGGTGLGLAIAERAILAHKGNITAKNNGGGLEVEITLDCDENKPG